jgi:cell division septum initiation protein DivIVA
MNTEIELKNKISELKKENKELKEQNKELKTQNDFMLNQIEKKTDTNFELRKEIDKLKPNFKQNDKKTS